MRRSEHSINCKEKEPIESALAFFLGTDMRSSQHSVSRSKTLIVVCSTLILDPQLEFSQYCCLFSRRSLPGVFLRLFLDLRRSD